MKNQVDLELRQNSFQQIGVENRAGELPLDEPRDVRVQGIYIERHDALMALLNEVRYKGVSYFAVGAGYQNNRFSHSESCEPAYVTICTYLLWNTDPRSRALPAVTANTTSNSRSTAARSAAICSKSRTTSTRFVVARPTSGSICSIAGISAPNGRTGRRCGARKNGCAPASATRTSSRWTKAALTWCGPSALAASSAWTRCGSRCAASRTPDPSKISA